MNKHLWLNFLMILYCIAGLAQQNDSVLSALPVLSTPADSMITGISCAVVDHNRILLKWAASRNGEGEYFVVEHSYDGTAYEMVGAIKGSGNASQYELTDNAPFNGSNFYRVKYSDKTGWFSYSRIIEVNVITTPSFKFYPNPVDKSLIIQIDFTADLEIISSLGAVLLDKELQPGLQVINVATLQKGNYYLRITNKQNNHDMMEHFLKN
jgi:hypothetical protein